MATVSCEGGCTYATIPYGCGHYCLLLHLLQQETLISPSDTARRPGGGAGLVC
jgi:hypothetical protein